MTDDLLAEINAKHGIDVTPQPAGVKLIRFLDDDNGGMDDDETETIQPAEIGETAGGEGRDDRRAGHDPEQNQKNPAELAHRCVLSRIRLRRRSNARRARCCVRVPEGLARLLSPGAGGGVKSGRPENSSFPNVAAAEGIADCLDIRAGHSR